MGAFNSNDIRGVFNKDWDKNTAFSIGVNLGKVIGAQKIGVGRDARLTSEEIFSALTDGIISSGRDVYDIGLCDTPALYFAVSHYELDGGVMITASHNPPEYNGMKVVKKESKPVGYKNGIGELEELSAITRCRKSLGKEKGKIHNLDIERDYLDFYKKYSNELGELKFVIDCSNGTAGVFGGKIISEISEKCYFINRNPDGNFPSHGPNPMLGENLIELKSEVLKRGADVGLCFDGDADRVVFIDEKGNTVSPDLIIGILSQYYLKNGNETILYDLRCSNGIAEYITESGGNAVMCPVGHTGIKKLLRSTGAVFGGELAGHYYFKDYFYSDSAWLTAILVLKVLRDSKESMSEIARKMQRYFFSGEINFPVEEESGLFGRIRSKYSDGKFTEIDGLRIDYPDWWFIVRQSTNEPLVRLVLEAKTKKELEKRIEEVSSCIKGDKYAD